MVIPRSQDPLSAEARRTLHSASQIPTLPIFESGHLSSVQYSPHEIYRIQLRICKYSPDTYGAIVERISFHLKQLSSTYDVALDWGAGRGIGLYPVYKSTIFQIRDVKIPSTKHRKLDAHNSSVLSPTQTLEETTARDGEDKWII